jgi:DNA helicase-2/ATP-dependent DNA helicase PcrA
MLHGAWSGLVAEWAVGMSSGGAVVEWTTEQAAVVLRPAGNVVVFAAPGSGKTAVLTGHLRHQLRNTALRPSDIMAVTFTREAALEVRRRLAADVSLPRRAVEAVRVGTFHAQLFRWLLMVRPDIPVLWSPREQLRAAAHAAAQEGLAHCCNAQVWLNRISRLRNEHSRGSVDRETVRVTRRYEALKRQAHRWDFDDILISFLDACETRRGDVVSRQRLGYLLIDEFQDTNLIQWKIIEELRRAYDVPVFVVGDDDQSIYGFRGASPKWLLGFTKQIPDTSVCTLDRNFRSDQRIVGHAQRLIAHNQERAPKTIRAVSPAQGFCLALQWADERSEAVGVGRLIAQELREASVERTVAVLARTRTQLMSVWSSMTGPLRSRVEFRTFHEAKGREWDSVHVIGAVEANPYLADVDEGMDKEEERRLFYVAMTRARHVLTMHIPLRMKGRRARVSAFVEECGVVPGRTGSRSNHPV